MNRIVGVVALTAMGLAIACSTNNDATAGDGGATSTGTPGSGATKSAAIGPTGGSIVIEGATLTVPAGALATEQSITITSTTGSGPAGASRYSPVYTFEPAGLVFQSPATVEIAYSGTVETAPKAALFWSSSDGLKWDTIVSATATTTSVKGQVTHFSSAFVGDGSVTFPSRGATTPGTDGGPTGSNSCGPVFNDTCFRCQWEQCADTFALCFGPSGAQGNITGDCKAYGECICNAKTLAESQSCSVATDTGCTSCTESKGLGACAREKCVSACSGGG